MAVLLLLLGAVTAASGVVLVASGVTMRDGSLDLEIVTPGTIATIGGLLLVGMGLAVRELHRIEHTLAMRPMLHPARPDEQGDGDTEVERSHGAVRIPFPARSKASGQSGSVNFAMLAEADERVPAVERVKFPNLPRRENGPVVYARAGVRTTVRNTEVDIEPAATPAAAVTILKSGVVDGIAYTLYSDGSIEAQFPQGPLRFGSIAALRNHIDRRA